MNDRWFEAQKEGYVSDRFQIAPDTETKQGYLAWLDNQHKIAVEMQRNDPKLAGLPEYEKSWERGLPYTGPYGCNIKITIYPSTIGESTYVEYILTGEKIDMTQFFEF